MFTFRQIVSVLWFSFAAPVFAADLFGLDLDELMLEPVETASRTSEPRWKSSAVVYVIKSSTIAARGYRHLGEVLRDLAGVDQHGNSSGIFYNRFSLRGISGNNKFIILYDGVRVGGAAGETIAIAENYPVQHAARIEVLLSPASSLYGADALAGVVQVFSDETKTQISGEIGDFNYGRFNGQTARLQGWQIQFDFSRDDHPDLLDEYQIPFSDALDLNGQVQLPLASRHAYSAKTASHFLHINYQHEQWQLGYLQQYFRHPSTAGDKPELVDYGAFWAYRGEHGYGRKRWQTEQHDVTVMAQVDRFELDVDSSFNNVFTQYEPGYEYARSKAVSVDYLHKWTVANGYWQWGARWRHQDVIPKTTDLPQPFDDNQHYREQGFYPNTNDNIAIPIYHQRDQESSFVLARGFDWRDDISVQLAAQYGRSDDYGDTLNPRIHINKVLSHNARAGLTYGQAYLAPSRQYSSELYGTFDGQQDGQGRYLSEFMHIPNAELKPEKLRAIEFNYLRLTALGEWQFALYYSRLEQLILPELMENPAHDFLANAYIEATQHNNNVGTVHARGVEFSYHYRWWPGTEGWLAYGYNAGHLAVEQASYDIPYAARHTLKTGLHWRVNDAWSLSLSLLASDRNHAVSDGQQHDVPGYAIVNCFGQWHWDEQQSLTWRINNVGNAHWFNVGDATPSTFIASPQERRRISVGYRYQF